MSVYTHSGIAPSHGENCFIAPNASVIGNIIMGNAVSVWFNTVIRGDIEKIIIGDNTNVQDLSMLHTSKNYPITIGRNVSIGHNATIHGCSIGDSTLIGMGSVILDGVEIGDNCLVAAGSVLPPGKKYPSNSMIMGSPAKVVRELTHEEAEEYGNHYKSYTEAAKKYFDPVGFRLVSDQLDGEGKEPGILI